MRHIIPSLFIAAVLFSCKGQQTNGNQASDSLSADSAATMASTADAADLSVHPDLVFMNAQGPVKTITIHGCVYEFSRDGRLLTIDGTDPCSPEASTISMERDEAGYIVKENWTDSYSVYTWQDGRVVSRYLNSMDDEYTYNYTYSDEASPRILSASLESRTWEYDDDHGYQVTKQRTISYEYPDIDAYENWLRMKTSDEEEVVRQISYYE